VPGAGIAAAAGAASTSLYAAAKTTDSAAAGANAASASGIWEVAAHVLDTSVRGSRSVTAPEARTPHRCH
jgi:hypothetical protein